MNYCDDEENGIITDTHWSLSSKTVLTIQDLSNTQFDNQKCKEVQILWDDIQLYITRTYVHYS